MLSTTLWITVAAVLSAALAHPGLVSPPTVSPKIPASNSTAAPAGPANHTMVNATGQPPLNQTANSTLTNTADKRPSAGAPARMVALDDKVHGSIAFGVIPAPLPHCKNNADCQNLLGVYAECGPESWCLCTEGAVYDAAFSKKCHLKKPLGGKTCKENEDCKIPHTYCKPGVGTCTCVQGYAFNKNSSQCLPMAKTESDVCEEDVQCTILLDVPAGEGGAVCMDGRCRCRYDFQKTENPTTCVKKQAKLGSSWNTINIIPLLNEAKKRIRRFMPLSTLGVATITGVYVSETEDEIKENPGVIHGLTPEGIIGPSADFLPVISSAVHRQPEPKQMSKQEAAQILESHPGIIPGLTPKGIISPLSIDDASSAPHDNPNNKMTREEAKQILREHPGIIPGLSSKGLFSKNQHQEETTTEKPSRRERKRGKRSAVSSSRKLILEQNESRRGKRLVRVVRQSEDNSVDGGSEATTAAAQPAAEAPAENSAPSEAPPAEASPAEAPAETAPVEAPPAEAPAETPPVEAPPAEAPAETPPAEAPAETPPVEAPPAEAPAETPPAEAPAESPPAEAPAETPPAETQAPVATTPPLTQPTESPKSNEEPMQGDQPASSANEPSGKGTVGRGGKCTVNDECKTVENGACVQGVCACVNNTVPSPTASYLCLPVVRDLTSGTPCVEDIQCSEGVLGDLSRCLGQKCICVDNAEMNGNNTCACSGGTAPAKSNTRCEMPAVPAMSQQSEKGGGNSAAVTLISPVTMLFAVILSFVRV